MTHRFDTPRYAELVTSHLILSGPQSAMLAVMPEGCPAPATLRFAGARGIVKSRVEYLSGLRIVRFANGYRVVDFYNLTALEAATLPELIAAAKAAICPSVAGAQWGRLTFTWDGEL